MSYFLVESYLGAGAGGVSDTIARARLAGELVPGVRHLRTTHIPSDETCLHFFAAPSADVLADAARRASLPHLRIVEALDAGDVVFGSPT
jgi:hypothetical protein